jgi:hypothetical protein
MNGKAKDNAETLQVLTWELIRYRQQYNFSNIANDQTLVLIENSRKKKHVYRRSNTNLKPRTLHMQYHNPSPTNCRAKPHNNNQQHTPPHPPPPRAFYSYILEVVQNELSF